MQWSIEAQMSKENFTQVQKQSINKFNKMVSSGDLSFEEKDCLCGNSGFVEISKFDRFGFPQRVVVCQKCGLVMSNPSLTDKSYRLFYSSDIYRMIYENLDYLESAEERLNNDYSKYLFDDLSPNLEKGKESSILEFGCGGGWNLIHFFKAGYKGGVGYDYSPNLTQLGRKYGLDLRKGSIQDIEGEYDVIIVNHVMEHFTDLLGSMKSIIKHLKPGGILYIGVPNIDNYGLGQLQNAHTYYFTPRTFEYYMGHCGLRIIKHGAVHNLHMYGIFESGESDSDISTLEDEPKRIMKTIRKAHLREGIGNALEKMGIKKLIKSAMGKILPKK